MDKVPDLDEMLSDLESEIRGFKSVNTVLSEMASLQKRIEASKSLHETYVEKMSEIHASMDEIKESQRSWLDSTVTGIEKSNKDMVSKLDKSLEDADESRRTLRRDSIENLQRVESTFGSRFDDFGSSLRTTITERSQDQEKAIRQQIELASKKITDSILDEQKKSWALTHRILNWNLTIGLALLGLLAWYLFI